MAISWHSVDYFDTFLLVFDTFLHIKKAHSTMCCEPLKNNIF